MSMRVHATRVARTLLLSRAHSSRVQYCGFLGVLLGIMVRIQPSTLAKVLTRTRKPSIDLLSELDVPLSLWNQLKIYASNPQLSPRSGRESSSGLLTKLFESCQSPKHRIVVGSLILDQGLRLPSKLEALYIESLIDSGMALQALQLWRRRPLETSSERKQWVKLGILSLCRCYRVQPAEQLASKTTTVIDQGICMTFIRAYADLQQGKHVDIWTKKLFCLNPNPKTSNAVLDTIITARLWPQAQNVIKLMSDIRQRVNTDTMASCITAIQQDVPLLTLATMLGEDATLVNSSKFRQLLASDIRIDVRKLLDNGETSEAVKKVLDYEGVHDLSLCYQVLRHQYRSTIGESEPVDYNMLTPLVNKVSRTPVQNSLYVQFMLVYYQMIDDFASFWSFCEEHKLLTASPKISGKLSSSNYTKLWQLLLTYSTKAANLSTGPSKSLNPLPFSLRDFAITTTYNTALRTNLLNYILLTLNTIPDLPAMVSIIEFSEVVCGVPVESSLIEKITGEHYDQTNGASSDWQEKAGILCRSKNTDLSTSIDQAKEYRKHMQFMN